MTPEQHANSILDIPGISPEIVKFVLIIRCEACKGLGTNPNNKCVICGGTGIDPMYVNLADIMHQSNPNFFPTNVPPICSIINH